MDAARRRPDDRPARRLHDATIGLDLPLTGWRRDAVEPVEVVCHGDVAPYNCVFAGGRFVALIDWDHARPGPRLLDLGEAVYRFCTLTPPGHRDRQPFQSVAEQWRRVGVLAAAYGGVDPEDVVRWALWHLRDLIAYSLERAALGDAAMQHRSTRATCACTRATCCGCGDCSRPRRSRRCHLNP